MENLTFILGALATGVVMGGQAVISDAFKDAYSSLKALIRTKVSGKPSVLALLTNYESDPQKWESSLKQLLIQERIDKDTEIVASAQRVLSLAYLKQTIPSNYYTPISGNVYGLAQGENQHVDMNFKE